MVTILLGYQVRLGRLPVYQLDTKFFSTQKSLKSGYHLLQLTLSIFDDKKIGNKKRTRTITGIWSFEIPYIREKIAVHVRSAIA